MFFFLVRIFQHFNLEHLYIQFSKECLYIPSHSFTRQSVQIKDYENTYILSHNLSNLNWDKFWRVYAINFLNLAVPNFTNRHTSLLIFAGITTLLTTCTIALTGREGIPKVSYSTALDIFLLMCFSFVFAALVEYAGVFYFTKSAVVSLVDKSDEEEEVK